MCFNSENLKQQSLAKNSFSRCRRRHYLRKKSRYFGVLSKNARFFHSGRKRTDVMTESPLGPSPRTAATTPPIKSFALPTPCLQVDDTVDEASASEGEDDEEDEEEDEEEECVSMQQLWSDFDTLQEEEDREKGIDRDACDSPVLVRLPCGDLHLCGRGIVCPFLKPNEDRVLVCMYTGIEHGPEHTDEFFDLNGGIVKKSGDPDQSCGELMYSKWSRRVDPVAASRAAYEAARHIEEGSTDMSEFIRPSSNAENASKKPIKRGALCVGETVDSPAFKRGRISKRNVGDRSTITNLLSEAESVVTKLINFDRTASFKRKATADKIERKKPPIDPRMMQESFAFQVCLKRYLRTCTANSTQPTFNDVHNVALCAQAISRKAREDSGTDKGASIRSAKFRSSCANLIVALWSAACSTPYMSVAKRGTDAFRPFICGALFGSCA